MSWTTDDGKTAREMIFKEAELINDRFTWLVTLQGLLFAALGFAWKDGRELIPCLFVLGVGSSLSSLAILWCSQEAIKRMKQQWDKNKPDNYNGPDVIGFIPNIRGFSLILPWLSLPILFIGAWIAVIVISFSRA